MKREFSKLLQEKGRKQLPNVLIAAAECAPLCKTGGLADVVGTLPKSLKQLGIDARVIIPYHRIVKEKYSDKVTHMFHFYVQLGWRSQYVGVEKLELDGLTIYLLDSEYYYGDTIYRGGNAEGEQYAFFSKAVLDCIPNLDYPVDVVHCNDWHTAMIPMLAKTQYCSSMQSGLKYLLTIHNIKFQGQYGFDYVKDLLDIDDKYYTPEFMELNGCADFMKAGCVFADRINTVSPTYANEIQGSYYGEGLEGILSARHAEVSGIVNGIDKTVYNPKTDECIPYHFDKGHLNGKAKCKQALQERFGLEVRPDVPIIAMVTRITGQKGFDLVKAMLYELMDYNDMQFILLGSGESDTEEFMRNSEEHYKGRVCAYIGYSEELSHLIYAGSDFYLMPSLFEPCGISQMLAMRYGSIPIVRETGGLKDTVNPYNMYTGEGNGFSFTNYNAHEMKETILHALEAYKDKEIMKGLIQSAMATDFAFDNSAEEYARLYIWML